MGKKDEKTNVMRLLDAAGVAYTEHHYAQDPTKTGEEIAALLGENPAAVFKTLVTVGKSGKHYVFAVPVAGSLNLKKSRRRGGREVCGDDPPKGAVAADRLCARRMFAARNEKGVSHLFR